ncbi:hypothetical protein D3C72_1068740 [compost metagenome]
MHQPFDIEFVELYEDAERGNRADRAGEVAAELVAHEVALQPGFHVTRGLVGPALVRRAVQAQLVPDRLIALGPGGRVLRLLLGVGRIHAARLGRDGRVQFGARRERRLILGVRQHGLDRAVHEQVGIAADRAREVGICLIRETEVADVVGAVDRLLHRAQQHGLEHRRVRAGLDLVHHLGVVRCLRLVAAAQ